MKRLKLKFNILNYKILKKNSPILLFVLVIFIGFFSSLTYWIGIYQGKVLSQERDQNKWTSINVVLDNLLNNYVDSLDSNELSCSLKLNFHILVWSISHLYCFSTSCPFMLITSLPDPFSSIERILPEMESVSTIVLKKELTIL